MKDRDAYNDGDNTAGDLQPAANSPNDKTKRPNKPRNAANKSDKDKKKSFRRSWRSASPLRKLELIGIALAAAAAIAYSGITVWGILESKWNAQSEHRPRVVFSQPPRFTELSCGISGNQLNTQIGAVRIWVKNIRSGDALNAEIVPFNWKLIAEKKTGEPGLDDPPSITETDCSRQFKTSKTVRLKFPINTGQETSVLLDGFGVAESPIPNSFKPGDALRFYAPLCVYYRDEQNAPHGTCAMYMLDLNGRYSFSCSESPIRGSLDLSLYNQCEK
jgi:hypothetical protein